MYHESKMCYIQNLPKFTKICQNLTSISQYCTKLITPRSDKDRRLSLVLVDLDPQDSRQETQISEYSILSST